MDSDPLWKCLDSSKCLTRDQLELVIQKKKINEVFSWFQEHFVNSKHIDYISRCPFVIIQGPTGCGKTSTLKWISNELKITIKEYSETTDTTAINHELTRILRDDDRSNLSLSIDRRNALKFELFVINSIRYNTLYPTTELQTDDAASEFDSDDLGFVEMISSSSSTNLNLSSIKPPPISGVIIHIETPLTFSRSQRILIQSLHKLAKVIKDISKKLSRRVAIVFESLEGEGETLAVPTKVKQSLGIQTFKFNPIIKANMKKLVENLVKDYKHFIFDRETIDQLVNDCDGDIRACINSLQLICNRSANSINKQNNNSITNDIDSLFVSPYHKRQKLNHERVRQVKLNPSLMRDNTRSLGFFHVLGKIFYQKRLYPDPDSIEDRCHSRHNDLNRPFPTENSTEYLANLLDVEPKNLLTWLHQHYYKFCGDANIAKASLFLENLSTVDTTCIGSTLSSQFYEMHNSLDQLQIHLAIESTVFSLYHDQSNSIKRSDKKILTEHGYKVIKSSVESNGGMDSFNKPWVMNIGKVTTDRQSLLRIFETKWEKVDQTKLLIDYIPYMYHMIKISKEEPESQSPPKGSDNDIIKSLGKLHDRPESDLDAEHEKLLGLIEMVKTNRVDV